MVTTVISTVSTNNSYTPDITTDDLGNIHLVWYDKTDYLGAGIDYDIFYRCFNTTTGSWMTIELVSIISVNFSGRPEIAADHIGNIHVVWDDTTDYLGAGSESDIFHRCLNATTGNWMPIEVISSQSINGAYAPSIAFDLYGNTHVVWSDATDYEGAGTDLDIFYRMWNTTTGSWMTTEVVSNGSLSSRWPEIKTDIFGNIHIVWSDYTLYPELGLVNDIYYRCLNRSTFGWMNFQVISESTGTSNSPDLITDQFGNLHVVWHDNSGAGVFYEIFYKRLNLITGQWTDYEVISIESTSSSYWPKISIDNSGNLHIVWSDNNNYSGAGTDWDVFYKRSIPIPKAPTLNTILPNPDIDGSVNLDWNDVIGASVYYIYRDDSVITSVEGIQPIANVSVNYYQDIITINAPYYYVVIAGNTSGNSPISNCEGVIIAIPYPNPPYLNFFSPTYDTDGKITLSWSNVIGATTYYIYRDTNFITSVDSLVPIAQVIKNSYKDRLEVNGTYYYVVVAANATGPSDISNCRSVTVAIIPSHGLNWLIVFLIILGIVSAIGVSLTIFIKTRRSSASRDHFTHQSRVKKSISNQNVRFYDRFCLECGTLVRAGKKCPKGHPSLTPESSPQRDVISSELLSCPSCGLKNGRHHLFCKTCGADLNESTSIASSEVHREAKVLSEHQRISSSERDPDESKTRRQISSEIKSLKERKQILSCLFCITLFIPYLFFQWGGEWFIPATIIWIIGFLPVAMVYVSTLSRIKKLEDHLQQIE